MVKKRSRKKLLDQINKTREEIEKKKEDSTSLKNLILKHNLYSDYLKKKTIIANNVILLKNKFKIVNKLQSILSCEGTMLPVNLNEWLTMLERLEKMSEELENEYVKSRATVSEDNCQLGDIVSRIDFPEDDLAVLLQDAFDKLGESMSHQNKIKQYARLPLSQQQQELEQSLLELEGMKCAGNFEDDNNNDYNWRGNKSKIEKVSGRKFDYYDVLFADRGKNSGNNSGLDDSGIGLEQKIDWFNDSIDEEQFERLKKK
ncbi:GSCOCG00008023001-RA-CDS [Cotesia congregata]|nr:GSCOCG00008023001-RA-CDS [Cotesia congregata]